MIEEIKLNEDVSVYKTKIEISDIKTLIRDIKLNLDVALNTKKPTPTEPGIQSPIVISTPLVKELTEKITNVLFTTFNLDKNVPYTTIQWTYISDKKNTYYGFHTHTKNERTNIPPNWTYTYYVQMPDNLIGDDGKLTKRPDILPNML
jgi:hypothetical protein